MNKLKIVGVTGTAFVSSLATLLTVDALCNGIIPAETLIPVSLGVSAIQGSLAFFRELTNEANTKKVTNKAKALKGCFRAVFVKKVNIALHHMVI